MESNIFDYFEGSQLAMAAYATLDSGMNTNTKRYLDALNEKGMPTSQAEAFANTYEIIDQYNDPDNGFSGTLFRNKNTGEYTLALRGTEPNDFINDIVLADFLGIVIQGWAGDQIDSMNAYFERLITPESLGGLGKLEPSELVNVAGHSLGGHLTTAFALKWSSHVNHAYTYNGAGTGTLNQGGAEIQLREILGIDPSTPIPDRKITNLYAEAGLEVTAGVGVLFGDSVPLFIEDQGIVGGNLLIGNHSIESLTDSLALQNLFGKIDENIKVEELNEILEAASRILDISLEQTVFTIARLFSYEISGNPVAWTRDQFYENLLKVEEAIEGRILPGADSLGLNVVSLVGASAADIATQAKRDIAYRYALQELNQFAITGGANLYESHNQIGELNLENFSDRYLQDRAAMLVLAIERGLNDSSSGQSAPSGDYYEDLSSGTTVGVRPDGSSKGASYSFGGVDDDLVQGTQGTNHSYGGLGDDTLQGKEGNDYLEGGPGNDTLRGGSGRDTAVGGQGNDTYVFGRGDGHFIIKDADGRGRLQIETADGAITLGDNIQKLGAGSTTYQDDQGNRYLLAEGSLYITPNEGGQIQIRDYHDGDLGIVLIDEAGDEPAPPASDATYYVDPNNPKRSEPQTYGQYSEELSLWVSPKSVAGTNGSETIHAMAHAEDSFYSIHGGHVDSVMYGDEEHNVLVDDTVYFGDFNANPGAATFYTVVGQGDQGNAEVSAAFGDDLLRGGGGADWLFATGGDDQLYGDDGDDFLSAGAPSSAWIVDWADAPGHSSQDRLYGGRGNDYLISHADDNVLDGGEDNDYLFAGAHNDILLGGAGDDVLGGDIRLTSFPIEVSEDPIDHHLIYQFSVDLASETEFYGDDTLDGGDGNDILLGGGGNDTLQGGNGDDHLSGDNGGSVLTNSQGTGIPTDPGAVHGADLLIGGNGNDVLSGEGGDDELHGDGGDDLLIGGGGSDELQGGAGADLIAGDVAGVENLSGEHGDAFGDDKLWGDAGNDILIGGDGDDELYGGNDNDQLFGDHHELSLDRHGNDTLYGEAGDDQLVGFAGDDYLHGGTGKDQLWGDADNDLLAGGADADILQGGEGDDIYDFFTGDSPGHIELIKGWLSIPDKTVITPGDVVADSVGNNTLRLYASAETAAFFLGDEGALFVRYGGVDDIIQVNPDTIHTLRVELADGTRWSAGDILRQIDPLRLENTGIELPDMVDLNDLNLHHVGNDLVIAYGGSEPDWIDASGFFQQGLLYELGQGIDYGLERDDPVLVLVNWFQAQAGYRAATVTSGSQILGIEDGRIMNAMQLDASHPTAVGGNEDNLYEVVIPRNERTEPVEMTIRDEGGHDTLAIHNYGSFPTVTREGRDLIIHAEGNNGSDSVAIRVVNHYESERWEDVGQNGLDRIELANESFKQVVATHESAKTLPGHYIQYRSASSLLNDSGLEWVIPDPSYRYSYIYDELVTGTDGHDELRPKYALSSKLYGLAGDDLLEGNDDYNLLDGGAGNDRLLGGQGHDTYFINPDEQDVIFDDGRGDGNSRFSASNEIIVPETLNHEDLTFVREGNDLLIKNTRVERFFEVDTAHPDGPMMPFLIQSLRIGEDISANNFYLPQYLAQQGFMFWPYGTSEDDELEDVLEGAWSDNRLYGYDGNDLLKGNAGNDRLNGGRGHDRLDGGEGDDILNGERENDWLVGGVGDDRYEFSHGHGMDTVFDQSGQDRIEFRGRSGDEFTPAISIEDLGFHRQGNDLVISHTSQRAIAPEQGRITVKDWFVGHRIETIESFDAGADRPDIPLFSLTANQVEAMVSGEIPANRAPNVINALADQRAMQGSDFSFAVPINSFDDPDLIDRLTYSALLASGAPLPSWLSFDPVTLIFSGKPGKSDVGPWSITVRATDAEALSASDTFELAVNAADANQAPRVVNTLENQTIEEDAVYHFQVPRETFADSDTGDTLSYAAALADGSPLPGWLDFNLTAQTFTGTPTNLDVGTLAVQVIATDSAGLSASNTFDLTVENTNDAPVLNETLTNQSAMIGTPFSYAIPNETFTDPDVGESLTFSATLTDGSALPAWLSFDATNGTFGGTPAIGDEGALEIRVSATDQAGAAASADFSLNTLSDTIGTQPVELKGTRGDDVLVGANAHDTLSGARGDDTLFGYGGNDKLSGGSGDDQLFGGSGGDRLNGGGGHDELQGGDGNDLLNSGSGDDVLVGGGGDDTLKGGAGNDRYHFERGDGQDKIVERQNSQDINRVLFGSQIDSSQLWFNRKGKHLVIHTLSSDDQVTINNWYAASRRPVEAFHTADGEVLYATQVDQLVSAMAAFDPPAAGEINLNDQEQQQLHSVIAAAWEVA